MKIAAIVPSAGCGRRMRSRIDKPFIKIGKFPIISYVLKALQSSSSISEIIIAARTKNIARIKRLIRQNHFTKIKEIVKGGPTRSESVFNGLSKVSAEADFILVHDVARPFITPDLIRRTVDAAKRYGASVACVLAKSTIKESDSQALLVKNTLNRRLLWEAQTPQVFRKELLFAAYRKLGKKAIGVTDDTSLIEKIGKKVRIVRGSYNNIKITTPEDLHVAEAILKSSTSYVLRSKFKRRRT